MTRSTSFAAAATGEGGHEGELLRKVLWHSVALALLVGVIVMLYAHVFPGAVVMPTAEPGAVPIRIAR